MPSLARRDDVPVQLRRRRDAAWRREPLVGHLSSCFSGRDPWATCTCRHRPTDVVVLADYCCSTLGANEAAALATMGRVCTETTCARLQLAADAS